MMNHGEVVRDCQQFLRRWAGQPDRQITEPLQPAAERPEQLTMFQEGPGSKKGVFAHGMAQDC